LSLFWAACFKVGSATLALPLQKTSGFRNGIYNSSVSQTAYHKAKQIEATPGAPERDGDVLVPGYDVEGKLWTIQFIKEDRTKRFAKNSRKHGCFRVIGAQNGPAAIQKIAMSPVVVIAEGYATAATIAKHGKVPTLAAYDSGNLLSVATALHQRYPDKAIIIAGDDDHGTENNPGREKALAAAEAVAGVAIFPNLSAEQRAQGFTDFNDLGTLNPEVLSRQLDELLQGLKEQHLVATHSIELGPRWTMRNRPSGKRGSKLDDVLDIYYSHCVGC
jgi:putative DNA primase/helicase